MSPLKKGTFTQWLLILATAMASVLLLSSTAAGQASVTKTPTAVPQQDPAHVETPPSGMMITNGDLLEVTVYDTDFDKQVRVDESGTISLPMLGPVKVSGLSIDEAENTLAKEFSARGYFNDPQVTVFEREYATQAISVLGEVQKPGLYPLPGERTLFDAIAAAGGTTEKAGNKVTITHRGHTEQPEVIPFSYKPGEPSGTNPRIYPGDTVVVSKAGIVYVVGDVREPKGIVMENSQMTVLQAISMAAGTNPTAATSHCKVIRKTAAGPSEIPVPLKKILAAKAPDYPLEPGDILFVPSSTVKSVGRRSMEAIVQMATGMAIYRPY